MEFNQSYAWIIYLKFTQATLGLLQYTRLGVLQNQAVVGFPVLIEVYTCITTWYSGTFMERRLSHVLKFNHLTCVTLIQGDQGLKAIIAWFIKVESFNTDAAQMGVGGLMYGKCRLLSAWLIKV